MVDIVSFPVLTPILYVKKCRTHSQVGGQFHNVQCRYSATVQSCRTRKNFVIASKKIMQNGILIGSRQELKNKRQ